MTDDTGLLSARLLDGHGGARSLDWDAARRWSPEQGGLLWLHLDQRSEAARTWLHAASGIPEIAVEALLAEETRPRIAGGGDGVVVLLRGVNLNPQADPEDMVSLRLWCDGRRVVSTRIRRLMAVEDVFAALDAGSGPQDAGALLADIAEGLGGRMAGVMQHLRETLEDLEERALSEESRALLSGLSDTRREAVILRRYLAPQHEALVRLQAEPAPWLEATHRLRLREAADAVMRYVEDLDATRDRAAIVQEHLANRLSERMEQRMYVLSLVATVFLPLSFFTGLLGINVGGIPGTDIPWAFAAVCVVLLALAVLLVWALRRRRWM